AKDVVPAAVRNRLGALAGGPDRGRVPRPRQAAGLGSRRMNDPGLSAFLLLGALMFVCGAVCMATKRNAIGVLMGVELVLNGANLNFIAFGSRYLRNDAGSIGLDGQLMSLFVIVLAAAEAAVALAIALNFYNSFNTIDVDQADQLRG